ncbi:hypothetical protein [Luteirhabdus pelagi]|uniref:hypothetical protein n=1 Tax=Luteirhabdus pelagi TaxID=2792783 RepID=UPI00193A7A83|nr:hypothetical protein [Luteirhabdus pelagi]
MRIASISRSIGFVIGVPLLLLASLFFVGSATLLQQHSTLPLAISIDVLMTIPLVYFLLIRRTSIPNLTIIPFTIVCFLVGHYVLPDNQHRYLDLFQTYGLPLLELVAISFVGIKVYKIIHSFKSHNHIPDVYDAITAAVRESFPARVVPIASSEFAILYYGFIAWRKRIIGAGEFTYHKKNGIVSTFIAILVILTIETAVLHLLLDKWNGVVAWIVTGISIYTGLQVLGIMKSIPRRPVQIKDGMAILRFGILKETTIDILDILHIENRKPSLSEEDNKALSIGLSGPLLEDNIEIKLRKPTTVNMLYGLRRKSDHISLYVDNPLEFIAEVEAIRKTP